MRGKTWTSCGPFGIVQNKCQLQAMHFYTSLRRNASRIYNSLRRSTGLLSFFLAARARSTYLFCFSRSRACYRRIRTSKRKISSTVRKHATVAGGEYPVYWQIVLLLQAMVTFGGLRALIVGNVHITSRLQSTRFIRRQSAQTFHNEAPLCIQLYTRRRSSIYTNAATVLSPVARYRGEYSVTT